MNLNAYIKPGSGSGGPMKPEVDGPVFVKPIGGVKPEGGPDEWYFKPVTTSIKGPKGPSPTAVWSEGGPGAFKPNPGGGPGGEFIIPKLDDKGV